MIEDVIRGGTLVALLTLLGAIPATAAGPASASNDVSGQKMYRRYCGACHGPEAKGDGVASSLMRPAPTDLTKLAARNGGQFPTERLVKTIDGREMPRAHGEPAMPVWGDILSEELGSHGGDKHPPVERRIQGRILEIVEYLRTVQVK